MSGLPWIRLDTQFPSNPKILDLAARKRWRAITVYVSSLAYCGQHGTDGYVSEVALPFVHATRVDAAHLVDAGLWLPDRFGWQIHGWADLQVSDEQAKARRRRAQEAAAKRWSMHRRTAGS